MEPYNKGRFFRVQVWAETVGSSVSRRRQTCSSQTGDRLIVESSPAWQCMVWYGMVQHSIV